ncbi:PAS domain-containing protein, partial [Lyngbya confervoides]
MSHENWALTLALIANISSQKRSEAALKVIQVHLSQIISTTSDALIVLTMDGCVRFVNPAAESLFGRSKEQLLDHCLGIPCTAGETTEISII